MASAFCFCVFLSLCCSAQQEPLGDVARRFRAEKAAKQQDTDSPINAAPLDTARPSPKPAVLPSSRQSNSASLPHPADLSKESYVIETSTTKLSVEADGTATREQAFAVRIGDESGVKQFAVLAFSFTSANEQVDIDSVQVRKPDGTVIKTPDSNIQEMPQEVTRAAPMYTDIREKHIAVKGLGVGDLLEYKVRFRTVKPQVPGQFWFDYTFTKNAIIKDERLEISYPAGRYLNVRSPDLKPEIREEAGRQIYRWSSSNLDRTDADAAQPRTGKAPIPSVQLSTFHSWEEVGRWYGGLQQEQVKATPQLQAKAAELTKGLAGDQEKIQAIYNFVSLNIHYVGLSFGIGRYQPHSAEDVLSNEYGDCKDKYTLLASLLRAAGYDSWPVLINTSREIDPGLPSPGQFDHVIAAIPLGNKILWADTTPEVAPFGLLLPVLRDKEALGIPTNGAPKLLRTPAAPPFASSQLFAVTGKIDENGTFTAHMDLTVRGDMEVLLRSAFRQLPESKWKQFAQVFSYGAGYGGEVADVHISALADLAKPFHLSYDYTRKKTAAWDSRKITPPLPGFGFERKYATIEKTPLQPEELGSPTEIIYRSRLELPPNYTLAVPRAVHLTKPYLEYHATHSLKENVLISTRRLIIKQRDIPLSDWQGFRTFCKDVTADEDAFIKLQMVTAGLRQRDTVASPREAVADSPQEAAPAPRQDPRQAAAIDAAGNKKYEQHDFRGALADYLNAISLSPSEPAYYYAAGLAEGRLGNHDEAIAYYQKAISLSPHYMQPREDLGYEYWLARQWKQAASVYREMLSIDSSYKTKVIRQNLISALAADGQQDEAHNLAAQWDATEARP
jgi:hypothetical protein